MIVFPPVDDPAVSVIMVTYGGWGWAKLALQALLAHTPPVYEVVIVDNASPDDTPYQLERTVSGATLLLNALNLGFGGGNNLGVLHARASRLVFLNPDVIVEPGWLEPLMAAIDSDPLIGFAASALLNLDGSAQEVGSVVGRDGATQSVGSGSAIRAGVGWFRREVDYASAASAIVPRAAFDAVGGFDVVYPIGYYEDVDLCLSMRAAGYRCIVVPSSVVRHVRHGTSDSDRAAALMLANQVILRERWSWLLRLHPLVDDPVSFPHRLIGARDTYCTERILVIDDRVPHHDRGSGDPRMALVLQALVDLWPEARVTLLAVDGVGADQYSPPLLEMGVEVVAGPRDPEAWLRSRAFHYTIVIVSRPNNIGRFLRPVRDTQPQAAVVYDAEAFYFRRLERMVAVTDPGDHRDAIRSDLHRYRNIELDALREVDAVTTVSEEERQIVALHAPGRASFVVPHYRERAATTRTLDQRPGIAFYGGFMGGPGSPNEDAVVHLVRSVWPHLRRLVPGIGLDIVGADPTEAVEALAGADVSVIGAVADPVEYLQRYRLLVIPMRFGAGLKLRLLDAIAAGTPFVGTGITAEGLPLGPLEPLLVASEPADIAGLAARLMIDDSVWEHVHRLLVELVDSTFSKRAFEQSLVDTFASVGVLSPRGRPPSPAMLTAEPTRTPQRSGSRVPG